MRRALLALLAVAVVAAGGAGAYLLLRPGSGVPRAEAARYLDAWSRRDYAAMRALVDSPPPSYDDDHAAMVTALRVVSARYATGAVTADGERASAAYTATLVLRGLGEWRYDGRLDFRRTGDEWRVAWAPATLHPKLKPGLRFARTRTRPERAPILDRGERVIHGATEVVTVGIEPRRMTDRAAARAALVAHAGVAAAAVDRELDRPGVKPDHFVPIVDLRPERYDAVRPRLAPVPGIVFRRRTSRLAPVDGLAQHVAGRVAEVTAERLEQLGPLYQAGDTVGMTGLESLYERALAGTPSGSVRLVDAAGAIVETLHQVEGTAPTPVRTTLDLDAQRAAEAALAGVTKPAAIVAVDPATGEIRAAVSRPLGEAFNRALAGQYPPGSTFKIVTTSALLEAGVTPETVTECDATANVGGKNFRNFEGGALGRVPFRDVFAQSCNTAFVRLAERAGTQRLAAAATAFGFGTAYDVGLRTAGGAFPEPRDTVELAAAAIGQGRVVASPLHLATVAAAVSDGTWRPPVLVRDAAPAGEPSGSPSPSADGSPSPSAGARPVASPRPLDSGRAGVLRTLMAAVVSDGSAAGRGLPPGTAGKTGTAEFGTGTPLPTHAWFVGFRGDLAFSVLIEDGGVGGRDAAPVAARFLAALSG